MAATNSVLYVPGTCSDLALEGGEPVRREPFPAWPCFSDEDVTSVTDVLASGRVNYWTGAECQSFEREFAAFCNAPYSVALTNGTVALELALHTLGIGNGDEVVVTPRTFMASASCIVRAGARPIFADIDPNSQNVTAETIERVLSRRTKALILVHLAGWPCEMSSILELAEQRGLKVVEDCAQAHGATYNGRPVGSFGHVSAFSFCHDKLMTTGGEGGMLLTSDSEIWRKAWAFKDHGKSQAALEKPTSNTHYRWLHDSFGTNLRMTEMQAAIGRTQLRRLPLWLSHRKRNAETLAEHFRDLPGLRVPLPPPHINHAYYKLYAFVQQSKLRKNWDRDRILAAICAEGVPCSMGSCPELYREGAFAQSDLALATRLTVAHHMGQSSLMFMVHPTLDESEIYDTCVAVEKVMAAASL